MKPERIYKLTGADGYEFVVPLDEADVDRFWVMRGESVADGWSPVAVEVVSHNERGDGLETADFPWLASNVLVLRSRALAELEAMLIPNGELLLLAAGDTDLRAFNVTRLIDALDIDQSGVIEFPNDGGIMTITDHVFDPQRLERAAIFKIPQLPTVMYANQEFVDRVEQGNVKGLGFELIWEG